MNAKVGKFEQLTAYNRTKFLKSLSTSFLVTSTPIVVALESPMLSEPLLSQQHVGLQQIVFQPKEEVTT